MYLLKLKLLQVNKNENLFHENIIFMKTCSIIFLYIMISVLGYMVFLFANAINAINKHYLQIDSL